MSSIRSVFAGAETKELSEHAERNFQQLKPKSNSDAIIYCLGKYIEAELDFMTPGKRGLGRMTAFIPRFGAYFRKPLSMLPLQERTKLYTLIQDLILRGYLVHALFVEESVEQAKLSSGPPLYEAWIPGIYISDPSEMGKNLRILFRACTDPALKALKGFLAQHRMRGGGFPFTGLKTDLILSYYAIAGFGLRVVEGRGC